MYRIEITADTLAELAGKAATLAAQLNTGTATEAPRYVGPLTGEAEPEVAEAAPSPEPQTSSSAPSKPVSNTSNGQPSAPSEPEAASSSDLASPAPAASASDAPVDKDTLRTLVLAVVAAKGREAVEEILSTFGLAKASDVPAEQAAELVEALKGAL